MAVTTKTHPFSKARLDELTALHSTPFHVYDEAAIRGNARAMREAFAWVPGGFKNYYAVKALPNPRIMQILREEGMGFDCSSLPELVLAERIGVRGEELILTSNDTPLKDYEKALELGAVINLDDITHIDFLRDKARIPDLVCFRYNPGPLKGGNVIIGKPEEAKYGLTREQIFAAYDRVRDYGATRFGLHTMVASNELSEDYFVETARLLFELAVELSDRAKIQVEFINLGGGIGIPYRPDQTAVDYGRLSAGIQAAYGEIMVPASLGSARIVMENGRVVTGPYGWLVSRAVHTKDTYKKYIGLDANMANLMRPGMYGAYHHISVVGKEDAPADQVYDVTGSLCENNDKFCIDRRLPAIEVGDYVVIHDTGAHGHSMGFNYNGKLRSAEFLLGEDGKFHQIRRAETMDDYFATLDFTPPDPV